MIQQTKGIHHITAIVGKAQENIDFYASVLALRLVKKTINFDDPTSYHFYFGNEDALPGSIITFFPWEEGRKGKIGGGQVGITTYIIPIGAMAFWEKRLENYGIATKRTNRFGESFLQFEDVHGLQLELVEREAGPLNNWEFNGVTKEVAIKGLGGSVLYSTNPKETAKTLEQLLALEKIAEDDDLIRFKSSSAFGRIIDLKKTAMELGVLGSGTVHHIAWRANDHQELLRWQQYIQKNGFYITTVHDRKYFQSVYFRENGKILFEIATDSPGFTIDESKDKLGEQLKLPKQYEKDRSQLEEKLPQVTINEIKPTKNDI